MPELGGRLVTCYMHQRRGSEAVFLRVCVGVSRRDLVLCVHGGHRVLAVGNRTEGRLPDDILDPSLVRLADGRLLVDEDVHVQPVVPQQDVRDAAVLLVVPHKVRDILEAHRLPIDSDGELPAAHRERGGVGVGARGEREHLVKDLVELCKHLLPPDGVVRRSWLRPALLADNICAVERVEERPPAGVGRVEDEAGVVDGANELGTRSGSNLRVNVGRGNLIVELLGQQVADRGEELFVLCHVDGPLHARNRHGDV